jgi:putative CocE/NonD family hydrolase
MALIHRVPEQFPVVIEKDLPMVTRDGVTLYADVARPDLPGRFPVLVSRTPYGKDMAMENPNGSNRFFARHGYVTVMQDCRGRFKSEGDYDPIFQEVADGYDCVEWAARLPWSNGRVGTCGQSYMGLTQYAIACADPMPPSLQAMAPVSASSDFHESWVFHSGGASLWGWLIPYAIFKGRNTLQRAGRDDLLARMDEFVEPGTNFSQPLRPEWFRHAPMTDWIDMLKEAAPYLCDHFQHADDRAYWERANVPAHAPSITVPMLHISSWYDIFAEGAVNAFTAIRERSRHPAARAGQRLIMGPWAHLLPYSVPNSKGTGDIDFGPEALVDFHLTQLRWFDYHLKDAANGVMDEPPVTAFLMGENRWKTLDTWPPPDARYIRYFLHSAGSANTVRGDGTLSTVPPGDEPDDRYTYDPRDPVPSLGGHNLSIPLGVQDQRPVEERPDVLVFTSEPLERPLEVLGPVSVRLWATTSAIDTDFTAKLVDVHPGGYAQNLLDGIIRARYRKSAWAPEPVEPGVPQEYTIDLWNTGNVFLPGHRIRLEISSSNFPRFDANPNTGAPFGENARTEVARQVIHHRPGLESCVVLPVIPR